jgi:hypothetical protein
MTTRPGFHDVAIGRVAQRHIGVLFGDEEGDALFSIEPAHDLEDLLDDLWSEAH